MNLITVMLSRISLTQAGPCRSSCRYSASISRNKCEWPGGIYRQNMTGVLSVMCVCVCVCTCMHMSVHMYDSYQLLHLSLLVKRVNGKRNYTPDCEL